MLPSVSRLNVLMKRGLPGSPVCAVSMKIAVKDLGVMGYRQAHELQLQCVQNQLAESDDEQVLLIEHPPVFTLGSSGKQDSLLKSTKDIIGEGAEIVHTERGGDITYHGPGQLVVYPIINLRRRKLSVTTYIEQLEEMMLLTAADVGVVANRDARNRGIWVDDNKIGSVGIRIRHGISFHGLSLNVNLSLEPFRWIRPCGLFGVGVSSLQKELGRAVTMQEVKESMQSHILNILGKEVACQ